jgi:hypothetical protein
MSRKWIGTVLLGLAMTMSALADNTAEESAISTEPAKRAAKKDAPKADEAPSSGRASAREGSAMQLEIQQLKKSVLERSRELEAQRAALREQQQRMKKLEEQLRAAHTATASLTLTPVAASSVATPRPDASSQGYSSGDVERKSPLSFKIGSADFTPGGFADFTSVFRSTNVGSGIGTSFGSIPFNNTAQGRLTESRFSAQNSRVSLKVNTKAGAQDVTGYVEADFLGFQPANANTTSNSISLRMRLYWVDVKRGKWEVLAGQSWSLMNPNRVGLSPMPSDIFYSQDMDTNYQVGLTWARQAQFRFIYHPTQNWALGVSVENPQQFAPGSVVFPSASFASQFENGSGSTSSSSSGTNPATPNLHPDIILKTAFDGQVAGRRMHVEAAGLIRSFKVFNTLTTPATTSTITGGGGSINLNLELLKNFHLIANSFYSYGGGRYIFGLGPDVIVRPDGRLSGVHSGSVIGGFEYQVTPRSMFYGYYGGAYFQRNIGIVTSGSSTSFVGFGFPGSPTSANRTIQEGTLGLIQTFWKNPNYGALQLITQYSYLTRSPWSVATGAPKNAHASLAYVDVRYVLP